MPTTIKDIANELGLAASTVSAVLAGKSYCYASEKTKSLILATAERMNYTPDFLARRLRGGSARTIGVIVSLSPFDPNMELISHLSDLLMERGYQCLLGNSRGPQSRQNELIRQNIARGVDAIILLGETQAQPETDTPIIRINSDSAGNDLRIDRESGGFLLADHLIRCHGIAKMAFVAPRSASNIAKFNGCLRAMQTHALPPMTGADTIAYDAGDTPHKALKLLQSGTQAFICGNDQLARHLIAFLTLNGVKVPDDVAVTGFDDSPKTRYDLPPLTTVNQPMLELATKTAERLERRLAGLSDTELQLPCRLVVRASCGCKFDTETLLNQISFT